MGSGTGFAPPCRMPESHPVSGIQFSTDTAYLGVTGWDGEPVPRTFDCLRRFEGQLFDRWVRPGEHRRFTNLLETVLHIFQVFTAMHREDCDEFGKSSRGHGSWHISFQFAVVGLSILDVFRRRPKVEVSGLNTVGPVA